MNRNSNIKETNKLSSTALCSGENWNARTKSSFHEAMKENPTFIYTTAHSRLSISVFLLLSTFISHWIVGLNNSLPVVCNKFHFKLTASVAVCVIMIKLDLGTWRSTINSRSPRFMPFLFCGSGRELYGFVCNGAGPMHDLMESSCVCVRSLSV